MNCKVRNMRHIGQCDGLGEIGVYVGGVYFTLLYLKQLGMTPNESSSRCDISSGWKSQQHHDSVLLRYWGI